MGMDAFLSNREIALIVWILIFLAYSISKGPIRSSFAQVVRLLLGPKILIPLLGLLVLMALITLGLKNVGFWEIQNLKDSTIWFLSVGFVLFMRVGSSGEPGYFKKLLLDETKILTIIGLWTYLADFYVFSLGIELVLALFLIILGGMLGVASVKSEYKQVKNFLEGVLALIGLFLLGFVTYKLITDLGSLLQANSLREYFLPTIYTLFCIPYIYLLVLYLNYERIFVLLSYYSADNKASDKFRIFLAFGLNMNSLRNWQRHVARSRGTGGPINIRDSINQYKNASKYSSIKLSNH